jgi:hypothetical protein
MFDTRTRIRAQDPVRGITGRDGYIMMKALASAIITIEQLPPKRQERSDKEDMKALLHHHARSNFAQHHLDQAKAHVTGEGWAVAADHPNANVVELA